MPCNDLLNRLAGRKYQSRYHRIIGRCCLSNKPAMLPKAAPPRWACQAMFGSKDIIISPPSSAAQMGTGDGIGNTNTFNFGLIIATAAPTAKTAPEAPMATELGGDRRMKRSPPATPPRK